MKRAGLLNEVIEVLIPTTEKDAYNSRRTVYKSDYTTKARVQTSGFSRGIDAGEDFFNSTAVMTVRLYHTILPAFRIRWAGRDYRIIGIDPDRVNQEQRLKVELINE